MPRSAALALVLGLAACGTAAPGLRHGCAGRERHYSSRTHALSCAVGSADRYSGTGREHRDVTRRSGHRGHLRGRQGVRCCRPGLDPRGLPGRREGRQRCRRRPVLAHGIGGRADLPVPVGLAMYAGGLVVAVSFLALVLLWRTPRLRGGAGGVALPRVVQALVDAPALRWVLRALTFALSLLIVAVALVGPISTSDNLAPYVLYITLGVGLLPASLLLGPVWRVLNPLRGARGADRGDWARAGGRPVAPARLLARGARPARLILNLGRAGAARTRRAAHRRHAARRLRRGAAHRRTVVRPRLVRARRCL